MSTTAREVTRRHGDAPIPLDEVLADFELACVSRAIDDREIALQKSSAVHFQISGAGHEVLGTGLARCLRPGVDWLFPYYRDQALVMGIGVTPLEVLLEAVGAADDPASGGRQMPSHWGHRARRVVSQSSPTGSQCLPAVGCAEATRYLDRHGPLPGCDHDAREITYVSLGEGACSEGEFFEALSAACTQRLPVLFVVADNGWAISVPFRDQAPAPISDLVRGFTPLEVAEIDGCDYLAVRATGARLVEHVRGGAGPALLHAHVTRPYSHSSADDQRKYRPAEDLASEAAHDPIERLAHLLRHDYDVADADLDARRDAARRLVAAAARDALARPKPDPARVTEHLLALPTLADDEREDPEDADAPRTLGYGEAIRTTLTELMAADERVRVFGEDVADGPAEHLDELEGKGGVFGSTAGLQRRFGDDRCLNTPIAEAAVVGRAIGQGLRGLRPFPEVQFLDYVWPAMHQIRSEAATLRWRSHGAWHAPMVLRVPCGGYLTGGAIWHSQSAESIFCHLPGLAVVMPSTARDVVGMLRYAHRCEDPVLFLEHKHLLRQRYSASAPVSDAHVVPFGRAALRREGDDALVVTWGATVEKSRVAAEQLAESLGLEVAVLDLRSLAPWDHERVAALTAQCHRVLVVHEDTWFAGFGGEVAAWIGEHCFESLDAPIARVGARHCWVPYEPGLEAAVLPQVADVAAALERLCAY